MSRRRTLAALALLLLFPAGAAPGPVPASGPAAAPPGAGPARRLTILYLADLGATLEPCGCSQHQRGGLPRLATAVARVRREAPGAVLVAGGDLLFEDAGPLDPERRDADLAKARATAEVLRLLGLAASATGERDRAGGAEALAGSGLPFTSGKRIGDLGFGVLPAPGAGAAEIPAAPFRVAVVHERGSRGALARAEEARRLGVNLLLGAHRDPLTEDDVNRAILTAPVPVVQVQGRGQSLARIDVQLLGDLSRGFAVLEGPAQRAEEIDLDRARALEYRRRQGAAQVSGRGALAEALAAKAGELEARSAALRQAPLPDPPSDRPSLTVSFIPIEEDLPEDPAVRRILTRAYGEVARHNLAAARGRGRPCPDPARDEPAFIGVDAAPPGGKSACKDCHPAAFAQWSTTAHARAYATLEQGERGPRNFDLDCIGCHVTGWRRPGGACNVAAVEGRKDVQCESCHGPASLHAVDPPGHIERDPPPERCIGCHTPDHSTRFEMGTYRARVLGTGHGKR